MRSVESYLHRFAKQTLASWIRGGIRVGGNFQGLQPVMSHVPYEGCLPPMYNVYEEYPIATVTTPVKEIGNTRSCIEGCDHLTGWHCLAATNQLTMPKHKHGIPTAKELVECSALKTNFFFDVAMIDSSGNLRCVFEICHTNPIEPKKIKWLTENKIPWFEMSAEWIMKQTRSPYAVTDGILRRSV